MDKSASWTVDQLAAAQLLTALDLDAGDERLALVARHFARHRQDMTNWAAERAQANIFQTLETASSRVFQRENEDWVAGYCYAEQQVMTMSPAEMLAIAQERPPLSKGQILRSMVRQARSADRR